MRNDYRIGVLNGTRGVIDRIDPTSEQVSVYVTGEGTVDIPFDYIAAGDLTHGYATTIHKAQGATVDRCLVLVEEITSREQAYTALSRGRRGNELYVETTDARLDERHGPEIEPDALDRLRRDLGRSVAQQLATDHIRPTPARSEPEIDLGLGW